MAYRLLVGLVLCVVSLFSASLQAQTIAFIDEGVPATALLDGSTVRVRVVDAAANVGPGRDSVTATVTSDLAGDSESLSLLETGPGTGVFEGVIDLEPGGSPAGPTLATATSPVPPARDTLHATYGSTTAMAGLVGSVIRFTDDWGRESASFAAGHVVGLRVRDELRNTHLSRDQLTVTVVSQDSSDVEPVTLQETGMNTGVFEGLLMSTHTAGPPSNGELHVGVPDVVTATLGDFDGVTFSSVQAQVAGAAVVLRDADGHPADSFVESAVVRIRVIDTAMPASVSVQVTSANSGDSETVVLQGGHIYDGEIRTVLVGGTPLPATPGDGVLQIGELWGPPTLMDSLTVSYAASGGTVSATAGLVPARIAFVDARGEPASFYAAGTEARVRLEYQNLNSPGVDQAIVRLVNVTTGEEEYLQLTETRHDSGLFLGSMPLTVNGSSQWFNGELNAQPGDQIRAVHGDLSQTAEIADLSLEFLDEWGEPTDEIVESGTARVRMYSVSANVSSSYADSAPVEMRVLLSNDLEQLALIETGPDTNVFEGSIELEMGSYGQPDGKLQTANSGVPDYRADEVMARSGPVEATARTIGSRIEFLDAFGRETSGYTAGETVRIRIVDYFRSAYGSQFSLRLASLQTWDMEFVTMQETAAGSGIFEGSCSTALSGVLSSNGRLSVAPGQIEVAYATGFSPIERTARASISKHGILFVDAAGQPAEVYLESSRARVRVLSSNRNVSPSTFDTVTVEVVAELSQDIEALKLTETGPDTGVFEGSLQMRFVTGSPQSGNGLLETIEVGGSLGYAHAFDTVRATFDDPPGEPAVARIDLTGSRTWFGNAAGDEVLSYAVGGTAWVWVEDQNRNQPGQWDQVQVEVRAYPYPSSTTPGESEYVTLLETTRDSGIFKVAVPLPRDFSPSNDGQLNVQPGGQIEAVHQDSYGVTSSSAVADVADASLEFIDENGNATSELLERDEARVRMFSVFGNLSPYTADTVSIELRALQSNDLETLTLTETGADTGVFEGSIATRPGSGAAGDGELRTLTGDVPDYLPEEVTARFGTQQATARVLGARVTFFDAYGRETSAYAAGEAVRVRVVDHNRNDPQIKDSLPVSISSRDAADSETLSVQETGFNTAVFEGTLPTVFDGSLITFNGRLLVYPDDEAEASYVPAFNPNPIVAQAAITGSSLLFVDAAGQPATVYLESSRAYVRLVSTYNFNRSPSIVDTVQVQLASELASDLETLSLTETGLDTGVFEGSIPMRLTFSSALPGNGILETIEVGHPVNQPPHEFDTLRATYSDATGTSEARIGLTGSRTWFADATGQEVFSYPVGGTAWIRVEDQNRNQPGQWDWVFVEVRSSDSGDLETLEIWETSRDSGVFAGSIALSRDPVQSNDGKLQAHMDDELEARHQDSYGATWSTAVADMDDQAIEFFDEFGEPTTELLERADARVRVFSVFNNFNPGTAETFSVTVRTLRSGDLETVTVTETGPDTGVFEGSIPTRPDGIAASDGVLKTTTTGAPEYLPEVVTASSHPGGPQATALVFGARVTFFDAYGRETSAYAAGESVRVRVVDHNRNDPQVKDSLPVTITSRDGGDSESLSVQETGFNTAVFEGSLPTVLAGPLGTFDGRLRVYPDDRVEASYTPAFSPHPLLAHADLAGNAVLFIDAAGQPATVYLESSRAYVRVVSAAGNMSGSPDTVQVQLMSELSTDIEMLSLTETGPSTAVFEGSIPMRLLFSSPLSGNGILETIEVGHPLHQPPHEVDTLRATYSDPAGTSVARIGLTGSRTWFADATGQEVFSYPVGGTAWIRVEDQNRNQPGQWDRVLAEVRSSDSGDQEYLELWETSRDSGVFAVSIELSRDPVQQGDGKLQAHMDDQLEARHQDSYGATWSTAVADMDDQAIEFFDEFGEPTTELLERDDARVRVFSVFNNFNPGTAETFSVTVRTLRSGDLETVTVTETGPDTGVFEGSIPTRPDGIAASDGVLSTITTGAPEYLPEVVTASSHPGGPQATARVFGARVTFFDAYGRETSAYAAGESVRVRVVDHNRNDPQVKDSLPVTITSRDGGDSESLSVQETGFNTAVFEGSLPTVLAGPLGTFDGRLRVYPDDRVEASYTPAFSPNPLLAQADIAGSAVLFIDAAGQPATVYLESSRAWVRVVSSAGNVSGSPDTVQVQLMSELGTDVEMLSLTETGPGTAVFEGSIPMRLLFSSPLPGNGILETVEVGHPIHQPPHELDTLRATYSSPAGTSVARIGLTGSRTWFADATGQEVSSYPVGGTAWIRVEDQNRNQPGQWDRVLVEVRSTDSGDQEYLEIWETSRDSGVFAGSIELSRGPVQQADGKLQAHMDDTLEARHQDSYGATWSTAVAEMDDQAIEFVDEFGEPTTELLERDDARVRVFSVFNNFNPGTAETFSVTLRTLRSGDLETVTVTETGPDTGVFEGSIPTRPDGIAASDGVLKTTTTGAPEYLPEVVTASSFPGGPQATARVLGARVTFVDAYGSETSSYAAGESVRVRVVDHNRNDPQFKDSLPVSISSRDGGDSESLSVQETGFNTSVFEGSLPTDLAGPLSTFDGRLRVYPDDRVEASYVPAFSPNPLFAHADVAGSAVLFIDASGQPATVYLESSRAWVRVVSSAGNVSGSPDTVQVQLMSELGADAETLSLTETGPGTAVFEGSIPMRLTFSSPLPGNGILETIEVGHPIHQPPHELDTLRATYSSPAGTSVARIGLAGSRTWFADSSGQEVSSYPVGGTAWIRVEDQNRNQPGQWDLVLVEVSSSDSGDEEFLELWETSRDSGVFAVSIELSRGPVQQGDGKLQAHMDDTLEARHQDSYGATWSTAVAEMADQSIEFVDEFGEPTTELLERDDARVRVFSVFNNFNPGTAETFSVTLRTLRSGDVETVTVTETGPDTGVFEGSVSTQPGGGSTAGDGVLYTITTGAPEYLPEEVTALSFPGGPEATARVFGARVTFFDAYGRETSAYAAGESVRVRVVDHNRNDPGIEDSLPVSVTSRDGGDSESLSVQETGLDTAVFEGSLPTTVGGPGNTYDGQLRVDPDDRVEASYTPAFSPNPILAQADVTGNAVLFINAAGQPATVYLESSVAYVRVLSSFANGNPSSADTVTVQLMSELGADLETLSLIETGPNTGVFEGAIFMLLSFGSVQPGNGVLETVESGHPIFQPPHELDTLRATYSDPTGTAVARIGLTGSRTWFADATGQEVLSYPAGGVAWVRVEDHNRNQTGDPDMVLVQVRSLTTGDEENLELTETAGNSGIFAGSIPLGINAPQQSGDGQLRVQPGEQIEASHQDSYGATASSAVADITDVPPNQAPTPNYDNATTPEDQSVVVSLLANDTDPDNDTLRVVSVTQPVAGGTVAINPDEATVTYTPVPNATGEAVFQYTVRDPGGLEGTSAVTVTITPVNDPPVANDDTATTPEDTPVTIEAGTNDSDIDSATYFPVSATTPANGTAVVTTGVIVYTPNPDFTGTDTFSYTLQDDASATDTATVTVTVTGVNDAPAANADTATVAEDGSVTVTVLTNDTDPENDTLDVTAVTQGANGTVVLNANDTVTYSPNANFSGTDSFTYTISDGNGGTATGTVTVTVTGENDAPTANADTASVAEDGSVTVTVLSNDTDPENDTLDVTSVTQGANGTVVLNANDTVTYSPNANFSGSDSFTYTISDGNGGTATGTVTVTVTGENDAPTANADTATVAEDGSITVTVLTNDTDPENDTLDVTAVTQGAHGTVVLNANDTVTYSPAANYNGTDSFTYTISDGNGGTSTGTVNVTITAVNDQPVANDDSASAAENGSANIAVLSNDTDADNDVLDVTAVTQGAHGTVVINPNETVTYTPASGYSGTDSFTYTISDGNGGTATASVSVSINNVNDAPVANPDTGSLAEDTSVTIAVLANDSDPDNDILSVASVTQGAHGSVVINPNKTVTYTPVANYNGSDSFTYTASDGNGGTATATVTVTITAVNDAPVAVNDTATTVAETLVDVPVLNNDVDVDGPSLSVQSVTQPAHGTVSINADQTLRYTPATNYKGADSFTYTVADGAGGTASATVSLTVNAPPRVTTNMQVLYDFSEGSGTTVTDTSGVGTPLNLTIGSASAVTWISGGLQINSTTLIQSAGAATKVISASQSTNAITLEAWVEPLNTTQSGPAPIVTVSQSSNKQNFTLGQSGNRWDGHLRTSSTNQGGNGLTSAAGTATLNPTHIVYTRDASGNVRIYVNGVQSASTTLSGNFSTWVTSYKLGLVNQLSTGSPWRGKLYLVAVYSQALSSTEVRQNWLAGQQ